MGLCAGAQAFSGCPSKDGLLRAMLSLLRLVYGLTPAQLYRSPPARRSICGRGEVGRPRGMGFRLVVTV